MFGDANRRIFFEEARQRVKAESTAQRSRALALRAAPRRPENESGLTKVTIEGERPAHASRSHRDK